ncbi:ABC transporter permease subunit [Mesorhizobium sp. M0913]|uniref:carbohydrate ABC transporter permease n=1 Tax=Mesorhizobium sp. M0913 TaxID=2957026 RepID=UPI0033390CD2
MQESPKSQPSSMPPLITEGSVLHFVRGSVSQFGRHLLRQFFLAIPRSLIEAAQIDGTGWLRIFLEIFLPLSRPAIIGAGVILFNGQWQAYLWPPLVTTRQDMFLAPITLGLMVGEHTSDYGQIFAASTILSFIPPVTFSTPFEKIGQDMPWRPCPYRSNFLKSAEVKFPSFADLAAEALLAHFAPERRCIVRTLPQRLCSQGSHFSSEPCRTRNTSKRRPRRTPRTSLRLCPVRLTICLIGMRTSLIAEWPRWFPSGADVPHTVAFLMDSDADQLALDIVALCQSMRRLGQQIRQRDSASSAGCLPREGASGVSLASSLMPRQMELLPTLTVHQL